MYNDMNKSCATRRSMLDRQETKFSQKGDNQSEDIEIIELKDKNGQN